MAVSVQAIHIVMSAHIMKSVGSRKEKPMLLQKLRQRLKDEYTALCTYLTTAPLTASDLLNKSYEVVWKQEIMSLFDNIPEHNCRYSDDMLRWILSKENALDFLYQTWRHTDYLLTSEFADLLYDELTVRKDGSNE